MERNDDNDGGLRHLLVRLLMRLQAGTLPCMSWPIDPPRQAETAEAGRTFARDH